MHVLLLILELCMGGLSALQDFTSVSSISDA